MINNILWIKKILKESQALIRHIVALGSISLKSRLLANIYDFCHLRVFYKVYDGYNYSIETIFLLTQQTGGVT